MSKKNRDRRKQEEQRQQSQQQKASNSKPFSDSSKRELSGMGAELSKIETEDGIQAVIKGEPSLHSGGQMLYDEKKAAEDLTGYWFEVKKVHARLIRLLAEVEMKKQVAEELEGKLKERETGLSSQERDVEEKERGVEQQASMYKKKLDELLALEKSLTSGEYADAVKSLLETVADTRTEYQQETERVFREVREAFKAESSVRRERAKLEADKELFEEDKAAFKRERTETYGEHWRLKLERESDMLRRLEIQRVAHENDLSRLRAQLDSINSAFGGADVADMARLHADIKTRVAELETELNERPRAKDVEHLQKQVDFLKNKVNTEQEAVREKELLELKRLVDNQDKYAIEINGYKNQVESANVREEHLKKTIGDLQRTIDQLRGESTRRDFAFEFAKRCDDATSALHVNHLEKNRMPNMALSELVRHVQFRIAHAEKPFYYDDTTIRIFLAGLHMSPISILYGISGTGKTSLPREFAKAILANESYRGMGEDNTPNAPYRICAVQSGWRDNMDLMGHYNSFENRYKETDFFKALYLANQPKYRDTLFFIILDEMNLSRPEHYFADFLSLLEQPHEQRFVNLPDTPKEAWPNSVNEGRLRVPPHVRFIGTANHDETTLEFAPKTYDRSNVMEMPKNRPEQGGTKWPGDINITYSWIIDRFEDAEQNQQEAVMKFNKFIHSSVNIELFKRQGIGIGNRLEDQAGRFISVFCAAGGTLADAADHLVTSRLLRRMRDRYDLDRAAMETFQAGYEKEFKTAFGDGAMPRAKALFEEEIAKKGQK